MYWSTPYHCSNTPSPPQTSLSLSVKRFSFWLWALLGPFYTMGFWDSPSFLGTTPVLMSLPWKDCIGTVLLICSLQGSLCWSARVAMTNRRSRHRNVFPHSSGSEECKGQVLMGLDSSEGTRMNLCRLPPGCSWVLVRCQSSDKIITADRHYLGLKKYSSYVSILCPVSL